MIEFIKLFIYTGLLSFVALYLIYIAIMLLKPYKDNLPGYIKYPAYGLFAIGFVGDVLWNIIYGSIIFWQKPDFKGANTDFKGIPMPTLTERLRDIISGNTAIQLGSLRWRLARLICNKLLNIWDDGHCS